MGSSPSPRQSFQSYFERTPVDSRPNPRSVSLHLPWRSEHPFFSLALLSGLCARSLPTLTSTPSPRAPFPAAGRILTRSPLLASTSPRPKRADRAAHTLRPSLSNYYHPRSYAPRSPHMMTRQTDRPAWTCVACVCIQRPLQPDHGRHCLEASEQANASFCIEEGAQHNNGRSTLGSPTRSDTALGFGPLGELGYLAWATVVGLTRFPAWQRRQWLRTTSKATE